MEIPSPAPYVATYSCLTLQRIYIFIKHHCIVIYPKYYFLYSYHPPLSDTYIALGTYHTNSPKGQRSDLLSIYIYMQTIQENTPFSFNTSCQVTSRCIILYIKVKFTLDDRYDRIIGTNFEMFASSSSSLKASDASLWLFVFSVIEPRDAISQASIKNFYILHFCAETFSVFCFL